jgi:hypothetical protein
MAPSAKKSFPQCRNMRFVAGYGRVFVHRYFQAYKYITYPTMQPISASAYKSEKSTKPQFTGFGGGATQNPKNIKLNWDRHCSFGMEKK